MDIEISVMLDMIYIEYCISDDCTFSIRLQSISDAEEMIRKLEQAIRCAKDGGIHWRDRIE
jgi:hypothetical protein